MMILRLYCLSSSLAALKQTGELCLALSLFYSEAVGANAGSIGSAFSLAASQALSDSRSKWPNASLHIYDFVHYKADTYVQVAGQ